MLKKIIIVSLLLCSSLFAGTIKIAVAANVSYAIDSLIKEFNKNNPKCKVVVILGSSGKLTAQIKNGAPYGLFMSANMKYPNALYKDKSAVTKPIVYAYGSLAFLSGKPQDFTKGMDILKDNKISKIALANPKTAPYGKVALEAMKNVNIYNDVKKKIVYAESISQAVYYSITAADIGFVAKSAFFSPKMANYEKGIHWSEIDSKLYTPIKQGVVILKDGRNSKEIKAFYDFILSTKAKQIFQDFGYSIP